MQSAGKPVEAIPVRPDDLERFAQRTPIPKSAHGRCFLAAVRHWLNIPMFSREPVRPGAMRIAAFQGDPFRIPGVSRSGSTAT